VTEETGLVNVQAEQHSERTRSDSLLCHGCAVLSDQTEQEKKHACSISTTVTACWLTGIFFAATSEFSGNYIHDHELKFTGEKVGWKNVTGVEECTAHVLCTSEPPELDR
jgi:hypothetical protein